MSVALWMSENMWPDSGGPEEPAYGSNRSPKWVEALLREFLVTRGHHSGFMSSTGGQSGEIPGACQNVGHRSKKAVSGLETAVIDLAALEVEGLQFKFPEVR